MNTPPTDGAEETKPTARIAAWVASVPRERTREVDGLAIDGIRDLIGCMIGGSVELVAVQAATVASGWSSGAATIVGKAGRVPAPAAAFANGTAAHVLDFDDSFAPLTGHPSAPLVPAILALAEEHGASGAAVLHAYTCGLEVIAAIGRAVNPSHYMTGWHSTATVGVIGAAAACARLLGLNANGIAAAISIAVSTSSGSRMQIGHPMKSIHAGLAARDAITAALLAAGGVTGNSEALIGARSFSDLYSSANPTYGDFRMPAHGEPLAIASPGITFKPYPTCGSTHRSIDALLDLRRKHSFGAADIESVEFTIPALNVRNLVYDRPTSGMQARFSMPYCAALAIAEGTLRLGDFEDAAVRRPGIQALMPRIAMRTLPGSEQSSKDYLELPAHTVVHLKSGDVLEDMRFDRRGSIEAPMSPAEHEEKFLGCAESILPAGSAARLLALIADLASAPNVREMTGALRFSCDGAASLRR